MGPDNPKRPNALYYAMISPLQPYAIQGAIWYQGEANSGAPIQYRKLFPAMIECWRGDWGQGAFPFLFVQLASYGKPVDPAWPLTREAQTMTLSLKNTGMAVAIDVGEEGNIHPKRKAPVGARLALAARSVAYGESLVYSGPMYDTMKVEEGKITLRFDHVGGGLEVRGGDLTGFTIAGEDMEFVEADAEIVGETVVVSSEQIEKPAAARYAWTGFPTCNLFNKEGLPASPFRTDDQELQVD
jgi:sialate O-acetylesterase